ncbi:MAG TPA: hypothetical protein PKZ52_17880, partial [Cellvibrionaceae bacterium]|nr:hypothetical protein [Cellvibrionaceae bacterium]
EQPLIPTLKHILSTGNPYVFPLAHSTKPLYLVSASKTNTIYGGGEPFSLSVICQDLTGYQQFDMAPAIALGRPVSPFTTAPNQPL